jgi:hypothetical protein
MLQSTKILMLPLLILSLSACADKPEEALAVTADPVVTAEPAAALEPAAPVVIAKPVAPVVVAKPVAVVTAPAPKVSSGHNHNEVSIGTAVIGGAEVALGQGQGVMRAGVQSHLVIKLSASDAGASIVRAWIGTSDRTLSMVGKGIYAASHDDYDVHTMAPDPLPVGVQWWIEIEKPDGSKSVGSANPLL